MSRNCVFIRDGLMNGSLSYARLRRVARFWRVLANVNVRRGRGRLARMAVKALTLLKQLARCAPQRLPDQPWMQAQSARPPA